MSEHNTPLLNEYEIELREAAACKPGKPPLYATIRFREDISPVFPYLNSVLKGIGFVEQPPALVIIKEEHQLVLKTHAITISNLTDQAEAKSLAQWIHGIINTTWSRRTTIPASSVAHAPPRVIDILALLPKTNCSGCQEPTCMAFAVQLLQKRRKPNDCPELSSTALTQLEILLSSGPPRSQT